MTVYAPWMNSDLSLMVLLASAFLFLVIQSDGISRRRWALAGVLVLVSGMAALYAADGGTVLSACYDLEPYSWQWWAAGCWVLVIV